MNPDNFYRRFLQCLLPLNSRFEFEEIDLSNLELFVAHGFIVVLNIKFSKWAKILKQADV